MDRRAVSNLGEMQFTPTQQANISKMTLTDANWREGSYFINENALGTLLHGILSYAAATWQAKPHTTEEAISSILQTFPDSQGISLMPVNDATYAIQLNLGKVEVAFLIPGV